MSLPSLNLEAFYAVAKQGSFSTAAKTLHITQSALSQRVKHLEQDLGVTLFVRLPTGVRLTDQGLKLLRYCQTQSSLEEELLQDLAVSRSNQYSGTLRIGAYSSVLRSVIIPSLAQFLRKNPNVLCEFVCSTVQKLPGLLKRAEVDFIILDYKLESEVLVSKVLGQEDYVRIEQNSPSEGPRKRDDIFLDNNSSDTATFLFFRAQGVKNPKFRRAFFDDCYGIIDAVELGLGSAVMPRHLVENLKKIRIVPSAKAFKVDVTLHYYRQPFYSKLHDAVVSELTKNAKTLL